MELALAGVAQWIECRPVKRRVTVLIPVQGTCLGGGLGPQLGAQKRKPHIAVFLPLFPSLPFSLKINKNPFFIKRNDFHAFITSCPSHCLLS